MGIFDEDTANKPTGPSPIRVGEELSQMSEDELADRIERLRAEIERTEIALADRSKIRDAANAIFGKTDVK